MRAALPAPVCGERHEHACLPGVDNLKLPILRYYYRYHTTTTGSSMPADLVFAAAPKLLTPSPLREGAAQFVSPPCAPATYSAPTTGALQPPSLLRRVEPEPEAPAQRPLDEDSEHAHDDSGSWTAEDEPALLRFLLPAGRTVDLDELEQKFEGAIAQLLGCARDRIAWVGAEDAGNGGSSISFCVYAADEDESQGDLLPPSCATLGQSLIDICESSPQRLGGAGLEELAGIPLTDITDAEDEEWVDEVPEDAAVEMMLGCEPPLAIVRRLFHEQPTGAAKELEVLRPEHLTALYDGGFCVIDGALDPTSAAAAGLETLALESSSAGGFAQAGLAGHDAKVRDDRTLFLHPERGSISAAVAPASAAALDRAAALMAAVHRCASKPINGHSVRTAWTLHVQSASIVFNKCLLSDVARRDRDVASAVKLKHGASCPELQLAVYRGAPPTPRGTPGQGARCEGFTKLSIISAIMAADSTERMINCAQVRTAQRWLPVRSGRRGRRRLGADVAASDVHSLPE